MVGFLFIFSTIFVERLSESGFFAMIIEGRNLDRRDFRNDAAPAAAGIKTYSLNTYSLYLMSTTARSVIASGDGGFEFADLQVADDPAADEVLVRVRAAGVCHTDYDSLNWGKPIVMGHEGAGEVVAVGENVKEVNTGDRVALNWANFLWRMFSVSAWEFCDLRKTFAGGGSRTIARSCSSRSNLAVQWATD